MTELSPIILRYKTVRVVKWSGLSTGQNYCDQAIVSETMGCVSDDFIKTIDDSGQNFVCFYV